MAAAHNGHGLRHRHGVRGGGGRGGHRVRLVTHGLAGPVAHQRDGAEDGTGGTVLHHRAALVTLNELPAQPRHAAESSEVPGAETAGGRLGFRFLSGRRLLPPGVVQTGATAANLPLPWAGLGVGVERRVAALC